MMSSAPKLNTKSKKICKGVIEGGHIASCLYVYGSLFYFSTKMKHQSREHWQIKQGYNLGDV